MTMSLTKDLLQELFEYRDGALYNRTFRSPRAIKGANAGSMSKNRYWRIGINKKYYGLHRIIWMWHYGDIPKGMHIDHLDGNPSNNFIENLRCCTPQENEWNKPMDGVNFESGKWRARFKENGKCHHIGMFNTFEEAKKARDAAVLVRRGELSQRMQ